MQESEDSNNRNSLDLEQHSQWGRLGNTRMCHWSIEALLFVALSQNVDTLLTKQLWNCVPLWYKSHLYKSCFNGGTAPVKELPYATLTWTTSTLLKNKIFSWNQLQVSQRRGKWGWQRAAQSIVRDIQRMQRVRKSCVLHRVEKRVFDNKLPHLCVLNVGNGTTCPALIKKHEAF